MNDLLLTKAQLNELTRQQNSIIKSSESKIVVAAGPGSGKTYTMSKRIAKEISMIPEYQGVIGCSYTRESSAELERKVRNLTEVGNSLFGTLDSILLNEICNPFLNRYFKKIGFQLDTPIEKLKVSFPKAHDFGILSNLTKSFDINMSLKDSPSHLQRWAEWLKLLKTGVYELSFPSYILGIDIVNRVSEAREYFKNKYTTIYIDEAQDLNAVQMKFILNLVEKCNMKIVCIGDVKQSIYEFRGAKPTIFDNLESKGFVRYNIDISVRCHPSVSAFGYMILDPKREIKVTENTVELKGEILNMEFLNALDGSVLAICETHKIAESFYNRFRELGIDCIYGKPLKYPTELENKYSEEFIPLCRELLHFYFNYRNPKPRFRVPTSDMEDIIISLGLPFNDKTLTPLVNEEVFTYLARVIKSFGLRLPTDLLEYISNQMEDESVRNSIIISDSMFKVMTIHSSKGLEADNVIIIVSKQEWQFVRNAKEYLRALFVAITRAKNRLIITRLPEDVSETVLNLIRNKHSILVDLIEQ